MYVVGASKHLSSILHLSFLVGRRVLINCHTLSGIYAKQIGYISSHNISFQGSQLIWKQYWNEKKNPWHQEWKIAQDDSYSAPLFAFKICSSDILCQHLMFECFLQRLKTLDFQMICCENPNNFIGTLRFCLWTKLLRTEPEQMKWIELGKFSEKICHDNGQVSQDDNDGLPLFTFKSCSTDFLSQHTTKFFSQYVQYFLSFAYLYPIDKDL